MDVVDELRALGGVIHEAREQEASSVARVKEIMAAYPGISKYRVAALVGVTWRTVDRWAADG